MSQFNNISRVVSLKVGVATATGYIFVFAYLTESVVSIWSSVIACNVTCCAQRSATVSGGGGGGGGGGKDGGRVRWEAATHHNRRL